MGCLERSWGVQCVSCRCQGAVSSVGKPQPVTGNGIVRSKSLALMRLNVQVSRAPAFISF